MISTTDLNGTRVECLVAVLKRFKKANGWTIGDIVEIPPGICSREIQLMHDYKPGISAPKKVESTYARGSKKGGHQVVGCRSHLSFCGH